MSVIDESTLYIIGTPGRPLNEASMVYIGDRPVRRVLLGRQRVWVAPFIISGSIFNGGTPFSTFASELDGGTPTSSAFTDTIDAGGPSHE